MGKTLAIYPQGDADRDESERSGDESLSAAKTPPDPEVEAPKRRRTFSASYKRQILDEVDAAAHGQVGVILRREGLTSGNLGAWRAQLRRGTLEDKKRGRKPKTELEREIEDLRLRNAKLEAENEKLELIVEYQKKMAALMSDPIKETEK